MLHEFEKSFLSQYLPETFNYNHEILLRQLLDENKNYHFGNPLSKLWQRLKAGNIKYLNEIK